MVTAETFTWVWPLSVWTSRRKSGSPLVDGRAAWSRVNVALYWSRFLLSWRSFESFDCSSWFCVCACAVCDFRSAACDFCGLIKEEPAQGEDEHGRADAGADPDLVDWAKFHQWPPVVWVL